jgi:hypothetical protein
MHQIIFFPDNGISAPEPKKGGVDDGGLVAELLNLLGLN